MSGGADVLLGNLERVTAPHQVPGEVVEANAKIAAPQALQDTASREEPIQHEDSFLAASGLVGSLDDYADQQRSTTALTPAAATAARQGSTRGLHNRAVRINAARFLRPELNGPPPA